MHDPLCLGIDPDTIEATARSPPNIRSHSSGQPVGCAVTSIVKEVDVGGHRAPSWQRRRPPLSRDADAVVGARHAHSKEDETWDHGTVGLSHAGMRRHQLHIPLPRWGAISISGRVVFGVARLEGLLRPKSGCLHIT